ncbi:MAG: DUF4430 domain-containing protein, partial [Oscillospiraceae bacterium]
VIAVAVIALWPSLPALFSPGAKTITVVVNSQDGPPINYIMRTGEKHLSDVLKQQNLIEGEEDDQGFFINTVAGVRADASQQQWWCITKNGKTHMESADKIAIHDGDQYELTLTTGH